MKITAIHAYQVDLPLREGRYNWSGGNFMEVFDSTVVAVETDAGITGYAECCPLGSAYLPSYAMGVRAGIAEIAPKLIGIDPTQLGPLNRRMDAVLRGHPYVKAPIDIACWDILGKVAGLPVYTLLGGAAQDDIALYRAISQEDAGVMAEKIAGYRAEGYTKFQLKVGGDANDDIARIRACRAILQPTDILVCRRQYRLDHGRRRARRERGARSRRLYRAALHDLRGVRLDPPPHLAALRARRDHRQRRRSAQGHRRGRLRRHQPQDLQGRRPDQGAADARPLRRRAASP